MFQNLTDRHLLTLAQLLCEPVDDDECVPPFAAVLEMRNAALDEIGRRQPEINPILYSLVPTMLALHLAPPPTAEERAASEKWEAGWSAQIELAVRNKDS